MSRSTAAPHFVPHCRSANSLSESSIIYKAFRFAGLQTAALLTGASGSQPGLVQGMDQGLLDGVGGDKFQGLGLGLGLWPAGRG